MTQLLAIIAVSALGLVIAGPLVWKLLKPATRELGLALTHTGLRAISRPYRLREGTCLVFAPHQDDETLGCGGLIARKRNEGLPVHVVFITDGSASHPGHPDISADEIAHRRHREAIEALAILGVESCAVHFLEERDGSLDRLTPAQRAALVERLTAIILKIEPREIFLPCSPDGSSEHDSAFGLVCTALARARLRPEVWQFPIWSWWNPQLLLARALFNDGCCVQPTEDYALIKTRAIARYRTQVEPTAPWTEPALPSELVRNCNSPREFFFRYFVPPAGIDPARPPVL